MSDGKKGGFRVVEYVSNLVSVRSDQLSMEIKRVPASRTTCKYATIIPSVTRKDSETMSILHLSIVHSYLISQKRLLRLLILFSSINYLFVHVFPLGLVSLFHFDLFD